MAHLPAELIVHVARSLGINDIAKLSETCKYFHSILNPREYTNAKDFARRRRCAKLRHCNILYSYILNVNSHPHISTKMISCPYVTYDIIMEFADRKWHWPNLSSNPNINMQQFISIICAKSDKMHDYISNDGNIKFVLCRDSSITIDDMYGAGYKINIDDSIHAITLIQWQKHNLKTLIPFARFAGRGNITERDIVDNPQLDWNYRDLLENSNISAPFLWKRRRIDSVITLNEVNRYCNDIRTRANFECLFIHKYIELAERNCHIMAACSKLFNIDVISHYFWVKWDIDAIKCRTDIPMSYKILHPTYFPINQGAPEKIITELQCERGEITLQMIMNFADVNDIIKVLDSPIYDCNFIREVMHMNGDISVTKFNRNDIPPYIWPINANMQKIISDMHIDDVIV